MEKNGLKNYIHKLFTGKRQRLAKAALYAAAALLTYATLILPAIGMEHAVIEKPVLTEDGLNYKVSVSFPEGSELPEGTGLEVTEIPEDSEEYADYVARASVALEAAGFRYARVFDISIVDAGGNEIQPPASVDVSIELQDTRRNADDFTVVHFEGEDETPVQMDADTEGNTVSFTTESFSAYAIVEGPEPITTGVHRAGSFEDITDHSEAGLYICQVDGYYFTDGITQITGSRTGITKTGPASSPPPEAVRYYFEAVGEAQEHRFKAYCLGNAGKKYVLQSTNSLNFTTEEQATVFTIEAGEDEDVFRVRGNDGYYWNMQGGKNGKSFAAYQSASDINAQLYFWYTDPVDEDPYGLDGKTYGLMYWNGSSIAGKAIMTTSSAEGTLDAKALIVMSNENDNSDKLFVPNDSDIPMWTFHKVSEDRYHITTVADGSTKYLKIDVSGIALVSDVNEASEVKVTAGSGMHAGEIFLSSGTVTMTYSGMVDDGFSVGGDVGSEWLHFVELSELTTEYLMTYSARKVSVSDEAVTNGSRIIVYTRSWNDEEKRYDFYAISSDGSLVRVYEGGDSIEWISGQLNTLLWNFVEYYWEGTTDPNFYYELYNQYSEKFIAPQVTGGQILSDDTIGINLNGRRFGQYYSSILAWDDANYTYVGLKVEDGQLVTCTKDEAMDFYFAIMQDLNVDDELNTVPTVDHPQYGVTMKIKNFRTRAEMSDFLDNDDGGVGTVLHQGLLSTDLDETTGYPTAAGGALGDLYSGAQEVNHLFIGSTYSGSGYFEFDSTQNFAHLDESTGNFVVYKEIGTYDGVVRPTLKHGQFFPYNDLKAGVFASLNSQNLTTLDGSALPDTDPRKYEQLYSLEHDGETVDCYFAVELEATFTQTPSGLDAWGHDIIFEFTGDDDFWLYVDGELVIDLGGIHSAVPGKVNFRTGEVNVNGTDTTLYDLFYNNYLSRGGSEADARAYVEELFEQNEDGQWVFKDYTQHTMRIFYMERGAGASNLQMHFNLAAIKKGTVELSKTLLGIDRSESVLADYPYQILYKTSDEEGAPEHYLQNAVPGSSTQNTDYVLYKDTVNAVTYQTSVTIAGVEYNDVFFLKPDETAVITLPDDAVSYRIIECGIRTDVYKSVKVNDEELEGEPVGSSGNRRDFGIEYGTAEERSKVNYVNEVDPDALRTITIEKRLFEEDGTTWLPYPNDTTMFQFRLYLASEFEDELDLAYMHTYHVKDQNGYYCMWDVDQQALVKIGEGIQNYEDLTDEQKAQASFTTSIYGTISNIPSDHKIEIRNVLVGTRFRVVERPWEVPDGYSFQKYIYNESEYTSAEDGIMDVVGSDGSEHDPSVTACNIKGWGLRVNKNWSDADYMSDRDPSYFAVFINSGSGLTLAEGTVRQLPYGEDPQTMYWYFQTLQSGVAFDDYEIREVKLEGITTDNDGALTGYDTVTPVGNGGEIVISGTPKGENSSYPITYTVEYEKGTVAAGSNVRIDTVTNSRPGIVLRKAQWDGETPLANAVFVLTDNEGSEIGTFTSKADGLITIAFLRDGVPYSLSENRAPQGFRGLEYTMTVTMTDGEVTVSGIDGAYYELDTETDQNMPVLTIKDRPYRFDVIKREGGTQTPLAGVTFALHRQVTVGDVTNIDLNPMPGYEELTTGEDGVIPQVDDTLPAGVYELRETAVPDGYEMLPAYIQFSVSQTGVISLGTHPDTAVTLTDNIDSDGTLRYVMTIDNYARKNVSIWKTDMGHGSLAGASFELYNAEDYDDEAGAPMEGKDAIAAGTTGDDGLLVLGQLTTGSYRLVETEAPAGFSKADKAISITVTASEVTAMQGTEPSEVTQDEEGTYLIRVWNSEGYQLPMTGGKGTAAFYIAGCALMLLTGTMLLIRRRRTRC